MKKTILIIFLFLIPICCAVELLPPYSIDVTYYKGDEQPLSIILNLRGIDESVSISKSDDISDLISLNDTSLYFPNVTTTESIKVDFNIPTDKAVGLYDGKINYGSNYFPVYINIKKEETGCKIIVPFEQYSYSIKRDTSPYQQDFSFKIASACLSGVTISQVKEDQVIRMESGFQPIRLSLGIPSGDMDSGTSTSYTLEFDVSELAKGTYTSSVIISGTDKSNDESITKVIKYYITVVGQKPGPYSGNVSTITTFPTCSPSATNLQVNETYQINCDNVIDPNIKVNFQPDLRYFEGVKLETNEDTNQVTWSFKPRKIGNGQIIVFYELGNAPIGPINEYNFKISYGPVSSGTNLTFDLYGPEGKIDDCGNLRDDDKLVILPKDNLGNVIAGYTIYKSGEELDGNSFIVESGKEYSLSITAPGFNSVEYVCSILNPEMSVTIVDYNGYDYEINDEIDVSGVDNATFYFNNNEVSLPYTLTSAGDFSVKVSKKGYRDYEGVITVYEPFKVLTTVPSSLKLKEQYILDFNRATPWYVSFKENNKTGIPTTTYASSNSERLEFTPDKKGIYSVYVRNTLLYVYDNSSFFKLWMLWVVIGIVAVFLFFKYSGGLFGMFTKKGEPSGKFNYPE